MHKILLSLLPLLLLAAWAAAGAEPGRNDPGPAEPAWLLPLDTAIGPAAADYIETGLADAAAAGAPLVVLRIDTPGGLDSAMRDIIAAILRSPVPVACLVAPAGARAASAGTYILYACHIAAMAPTTHLGAATPVAIGGAPDGGDQPDPDQPSAMERKTLNDAVAYIRGLAELRGRNADWAEQAVRQAATLTASDALDQQVIDLIAPDAAGLLAALDGYVLTLGGAPHTLATANMELRELEPGWRFRFLSTITNPNVAYILMLIGIYGLLLEFYNPGAILPGMVGGISLLVALYAFQILPVSYIGLGLIVLGIGLLVAEALLPSVGLLGVGGVIAFVVGSIMLMDRNIPGFGIALPLILGLAAASAIITLAIVGLAVRARRQPLSGTSAIIGADAIALEDFVGDGWVRLQGERWRARSTLPVQREQLLTVRSIDGLTVDVELKPRHPLPRERSDGVPGGTA